jgi:hypothetical protein
VTSLRGWVTPCVLAPSGHPTNHHRTEQGLIGARVSFETGTHLILVARPSAEITWTDVVEISSL